MRCEGFSRPGIQDQRVRMNRCDADWALRGRGGRRTSDFGRGGVPVLDGSPTRSANFRNFRRLRHAQTKQCAAFGRPDVEPFSHADLALKQLGKDPP